MLRLRSSNLLLAPLSSYLDTIFFFLLIGNVTYDYVVQLNKNIFQRSLQKIFCKG